MAAEDPPVVIFHLTRGKRPVECLGRLMRDEQGPYAVRCFEAADGTPIAQAIVRLDEKFLKRGRDEMQDRDCWYYSGYVALDQ